MESNKRNTEYQRAFRERMKAAGLVQKTLYILPAHAALLRQVERELQQIQPQILLDHSSAKEATMSASIIWTTETLGQALISSDFAASGTAEIEVIQGADAAISVVLPDYGDLSIQLAVAGGQIFVSTPLYPRDQVADKSRLDEMALRLNPVNPLSNLGIAKIDNQDWYIVFGELSAQSSLDNVIEEIETLADNTIDAAEAFQAALNS